MDTKLVKVNSEVHQQAKIEAAILGTTLQTLATLALRFWRRLVAASRDAIEGDMRALQDVIQDIDECK